MAARGHMAPAALALLVATSGGCVLDWDGARPGVPVDAAVDAPVDRGADVRDAAADLGRQDLFAGDLPVSDQAAEAAPSDAAADAPAPDSGPPCTYVYSGQPDKLSSAQEVNKLVTQGYQVHSFVHATDDHAAWLVDASSGAYLALGAADGAALKTLVNQQVQSSGAWKLVTFLANEDITIWMDKQDTSGAWSYDVVQTTTPSVASAAVGALAQAGWDVHSYAHHAGKKYAAWLVDGTSYALLEDDNAGNLQTIVNLSWAGSGTWIVEAFLASSGYTGWARQSTTNQYQFHPTSQASTLETYLQYANASGSGWEAWMVHADSTHAAWLRQGEVVLTASDGAKLAGLINQELAYISTHKVERLFSKQHYAVWLNKGCP